MDKTETVVDADRWHLDVSDMTPGTRVDGVYAILNPQVSASRSGKPFLKCIVRDASGRVNGRMWSVEENILASISGAAFVSISGSCENFNDQIQLKIERIEAAEVDAEELTRLLPTSRRDIETMFAKYDTDSSGSLDKAQLTKLLTDLNDGVEPSPEEVDWVMAEADQIGSGTITKPELQKATSLWYSYADAEAKADPPAAPAAAAPAAAAAVPAGTPAAANQVPAVKPTPACGGCSVM